MISRMIAKSIGRLFFSKPAKIKGEDWKEDALIKFFGLNNKPILTNRDLMDEKLLMKKWIQHQEYKERKAAYEDYTGKKWGR